MKKDVKQFYAKLDRIDNYIKNNRFINEISVSNDKELTIPQNLLRFDDLLNNSTIITGESEKGKTFLTACFLKYILESQNEELKHANIFVIDMAPPRFYKNNIAIGGKISDILKSIPHTENIHYYNIPNIIPPRSSSKTCDNVILAAQKNYDMIFPFYNNVYENLIRQKAVINCQKQNNIIILNDLSILLHYGEPELGIELFDFTQSGLKITLFMNAYEGSILLEDYGSRLSAKEKKDVELIKHKCSYSIKLL